MAAVDKTRPGSLAVRTATDANGEILVSIAGELDMSNVDAVRLELEPLLEPPVESVVFDLVDLTFMDSSGIAYLVQVATRAKQVSLRHVSPLIQRVLEATGVTELLAVEQ